MNKRVAVALSGGVDSSATAFLLKQQGYDVLGVTARMTNSDEAFQVVENARSAAEKLQIPFYPLDVTELFQEKIINYFENAYKSGETPNPCIMCNKYIKWGALFDYTLKDLKAGFFATGHYADIRNEGGFYKLYPASDEHKDQLYFLFLLTQEQLSRTLFPLALHKKEEVREIAVCNNLPSKSAKESQDICFIRPPQNVKKYLKEKLKKDCSGYFVGKNTGKVLGRHDGFYQYTIGQRKGIGLAAREALYVTGLEPETNTVYTGYKKDLLLQEILLKNVNWNYPAPENKFRALVKIRYNMKSVPAEIEKNAGGAKITFDLPVSAVAKGQACVIYDINDGHLMGGAFI